MVARLDFMRESLRMDELTTVLDGPRAQGAFVLRSVLAPPWSIRIQDEAPITVVAVVRGECWVRFDDGEHGVARAGDVTSPTSRRARRTPPPRSSSIPATSARHQTASSSSRN
jgi:hypothetical protein